MSTLPKPRLRKIDPNRKATKLSVTLSGDLMEDMKRYAAYYEEAHGVKPPKDTMLVAMMVEDFLESDKGFAAFKSRSEDKS